MIEKENKVFGVIFITLIFVLFCTILGGRILNSGVSEKTDAETETTKNVNIDWKALYPYDTTIETVEIPSEPTTTTTTALSTKISKIGNVGNEWAQYICGYDDISKFGFVIKSKLSDPSIGESYIRLNNGYWISSSTEVTESEANKSVAPYASLSNYLSDKGIEFLYFYTPKKECEIDDECPAGVVSYSNSNIDKYLQAMDSYGVNYIDLREELHSDEKDHYAMFFKTDHHWTIEAGLWASSVVADKVSAALGIEMINPVEVGKYENVTYPNAEFGSIGKGVTHFVEDPEDFVIPYPSFETNYRLEIPNKGIDVTGSFEELFIDKNAIMELAEQGGGYAYEKILYGNTPYTKITNLNNTDGPKIFMIKDSFSIAVAPYLAASCSELVMVDTRSNNGNFTGSIINCINQESPDIVIALQSSPQSLKLNK